MNDLITDKLKQIQNQAIKNNIKSDYLEYQAKREKYYDFRKYSLPIVFPRSIHKVNLSLEDADEEQSQLVSELKDIDQGKIPVIVS